MSRTTHTTSGTRARDQRKKDALERKLLSSMETPAERIAELDARLGVGVGAVRERARLGGA